MRFLVLVLLLLFVPVCASANGYLTDSSGVPVRSQFGSCWRTSDWTPAMAIAECDPNLVKKSDATKAMYAMIAANTDVKAVMAAPVVAFVADIAIAVGKELLKEGLTEGIKAAFASMRVKHVSFKPTDLFVSQSSKKLTPDGKKLLDYVLREIPKDKAITVKTQSSAETLSVMNYLLMNGFSTVKVLTDTKFAGVVLEM